MTLRKETYKIVVKSGPHCIRAEATSFFLPQDNTEEIKNAVTGRLQLVVGMYQEFAAKFKDIAAIEKEQSAQKFQNKFDGLRSLAKQRGLSIPHVDFPEECDEPTDNQRLREISRALCKLCVCTFYHDKSLQEYTQKKTDFMFSQHTKKQPLQHISNVGYTTFDYNTLGRRLKEIFGLKQPSSQMTNHAPSPIPDLAVCVCPRQYRAEGNTFVGFFAGYDKNKNHRIISLRGKIKTFTPESFIAPIFWPTLALGKALFLKRRWYVLCGSRCFLMDDSSLHWCKRDQMMPSPEKVLTPWQRECRTWEEKTLASFRQPEYVVAHEPLRSWRRSLDAILGGELPTKNYTCPNKFSLSHVLQLFALASQPNFEGEPQKRLFLQHMFFDAGICFVPCGMPHRKRKGNWSSDYYRKKNTPLQFNSKPAWTGASMGVNCSLPWCVPKPRRQPQRPPDLAQTAPTEEEDTDSDLDSFAEELTDMFS